MMNKRIHKTICSPMLWLTAVLVMALALGIPHAASADPPENSQELHLGETANAVIETPGETVYFSFTPEDTDTYIFSAESESSVYGYFKVGSSSSTFYNKAIEKELTAGTTYLFGIRFSSSSKTGIISVTIDLAPILYWEVDENDVLTISGRGKMNNYSRSNSPWGTTIKAVIIEEGITSIGNNAFYDCNDLTSIEIPEGVTSIGESAFSGCSSLTSIEIPESVTSIGNNAFSWCDRLISITLPEGITSIGESAFSGCSSLISIRIPDGVTSIGESAFEYCTSLISITIPEEVTSIGKRALSDCDKLEIICFLGMNTEIGFNPVYGLPSVYCYQNSTAQAWAENQELPVVLLNGKDPTSFLTVSLPQTMKVSISGKTQIPVNIFNISPINSISWVSGNENILTVDERGVITPVHTGTVRVTLTVDGKSASSVITVCPLATELLLPDETLYAVMDGDNHFAVRIRPQNALIDPVCEFDDPSYGNAFINYDEEYEEVCVYIYPDNVGTTSLVIKDRYTGICKTVPIQIMSSLPYSIAFEKNVVSIKAGQKTQLNTVIFFDNGTRIKNQNATYAILYGDSAKVDRLSGKVTGIKPEKRLLCAGQR